MTINPMSATMFEGGKTMTALRQRLLLIRELLDVVRGGMPFVMVIDAGSHGMRVMSDQPRDCDVVLLIADHDRADSDKVTLAATVDERETVMLLLRQCLAELEAEDQLACRPDGRRRDERKRKTEEPTE